MAKITVSGKVDIPALDARRVAEDYNPMQPGPGTPWEDRGHLGMFKAFFQTGMMGLKEPARLFRLIRRPETGSDASAYLVGCALLWLLSAAVHAAIAYVLVARQQGTPVAGPGGKMTTVDVDTTAFIYQWGLIVLLTPLTVVLLNRMAALLVHRLAVATASGIGSRSPTVLTQNVLAYAMAPSLLAPIPYVGPLLAAAWITALIVVGARARLRVSFANALTCSIIAGAACVAIAMVLYYGGRSLWSRLYGEPVTEKPAVVPRRLDRGGGSVGGGGGGLPVRP